MEGIELTRKERFIKLITSKKFLYYGWLPILAFLLLFYGLWRQGVISSWFDGMRRASVTLITIDQDNQLISGASITIGKVNAISDINGATTITGLTSGKKTVAIKKVGFRDYEKQFVLKKGTNELGRIALTEIPSEKTTVSIIVTDYVTGKAVADASVALDTAKPIAQNGGYLFSQIPIGSYTLKIDKRLYNAYEKTVEITADTVEIDDIKLVPSGRVAFESNRSGGVRSIYSSNLDGTDQKLLVEPKAGFEDYSPTTSPDQTKVVFKTTRDAVKQGASYIETLYVINIDGTGLNRLSAGDVAISEFRWSSSGKYVAYNTDYTTVNGLNANQAYIYELAKKTNRQITGYRNIDIYSSTFNNDDSYFAFSGTKDDGTQGTYLLSLPQFESKTLLDQQSAYGIESTPEGLRYHYYDSNLQGERYFEYNTSTGQSLEITKPTVDRNTGIISPDKTKLAYMANRDGKRNLYVSNLNYANEQKLTNLGTVVQDKISWSSDGSYLTFVSASQSESSLYIVASSGLVEPIKVVDISYSQNQ